MIDKKTTICICGALCAFQGALMFVPPVSAVSDLMGAVGFGWCGYMVGRLQ